MSNRKRKDMIHLKDFICKNKKDFEIDYNEKSTYLEKACPDKGFSSVWEWYWPLKTNNLIQIIAVYFSINNKLIQKWSVNMPTPNAFKFPEKNLFNLDICLDKNEFDFNILIENIPSCGNPVCINICPKSQTFPLNLNQTILFRDPNTYTNVLATISYFNSTCNYYNQILDKAEFQKSTKSLVFSNQLFFMHINQIDLPVKMSLSHSTVIGENLANISLQSNGNLIEVREDIYPVLNSTNVNILSKTIYIGGVYFMTFAVYKGDIFNAVKFGQVPNTLDSRQIPLQLQTMILYNSASIPVLDLNNAQYENIFQQELLNTFNILKL